MHFRNSRGFLCFCLVALLAVAFARADTTPSSGDEAEADRLYHRANDYILAVKEGGYSYSYLQFYWKRAQGNVDRVLRLYPNTRVGQELRNGQRQLGPFPIAYFRERVLPRVEEKRIAADDAISCAIFLGEIKGSTWDDSRRLAALKIIEVLSRQKRWAEALKFPVLDPDKPLKMATVFQVAARFEQADLVKDLLVVTPKDQLTQFHAILAEAMALRGIPRSQLAELIASDPAVEVRLAALRGMIAREVEIRRTAALRLPANLIILAGDSLKRPETRDDVVAAARGFFPEGEPAADDLLAGYRAALGEVPARNASVATREAYLHYLAAFEKYDELAAYPKNGYIADADRAPLQLVEIEALANAGHTAAAEAAVARFATGGVTASDEAVLANFRGRMRSADIPLVVHADTFAALPIHDPSILAQAMMEWSLTLNRSVRGASPYDAVVNKFAHGFANLPAPKSAAVQQAASVQKPY